MLTDLGKRIDLHSDNFKKELENIKKTQLEMKNLIAEIKNTIEGFPGGAVVKNLLANAGDTGSGPGLGRSHMPRSN